MAAQPDCRIRITVAENPRGLLFAAEVISGETRQVALLPWPAPPRAEAKPRTRLEMQPMIQQLEPVLDVLLLDSGQTLLCLTPTKISTYRLINGKWNFSGVTAISLARPPARDARGRIENSQSGFHVYLPGTTCNGILQPDVKVNCSAGNDSWPANPRDSSLMVRWISDQNVLEADGVRSKFYTMGDGFFAGADGKVQDRSGESIAGTEVWGSDLAALEGSCGLNSVVVVSKAGDRADQDDIQGYEVANGAASPVSTPMALPGPVMALWPSEVPGQATLVIRNSKTGNYEASRLRVACAE